MAHARDRARGTTQPVICSPALPAGRSWWRLLPAWIVSAALHLVLLLLSLGINLQLNADAVAIDTSVIDFRTDDSQPPDHDFLNDNVGIDAANLAGLDLPREEELNVVGPVNPAEA